jgi:hypothetical protein
VTSSKPSPSKRCAYCRAEFAKRPRESWAQWEARKVCSRECRPSVAERLWTNVRIAGSDDCWPWLGSVTGSNHGTIRTARSRSDPVHRVAWEMLKGPIPDGLEIHHRCENPICCNTAHMELLTHGDHARVSDGAAYLRERDACKHGHPFDERNTYRMPNGARACKVCRQDAVLRYRARRRLAVAHSPTLRP